MLRMRSAGPLHPPHTTVKVLVQGLGLVAEWIHFTLFWIMLPTIKLKVYTFWGL